MEILDCKYRLVLTKITNLKSKVFKKKIQKRQKVIKK